VCVHACEFPMNVLCEDWVRKYASHSLSRKLWVLSRNDKYLDILAVFVINFVYINIISHWII
jgi:5-methylcytosine-specific restriction endonuclease McrBC regulatory subunit McrC